MWKRAGLIAAACLLMAGSVSAFDTVYLDNNKNYPMIENTGSIYNDGSVGRFLDLSSVTVDDVFSDGLSVTASVKDRGDAGKETKETVSLRLADDGTSWAKEDGGYREVYDTAGDALGHAAALIREDMGTKSKRAKYLSQIVKVSQNKKEEGTVVPETIMEETKKETPKEIKKEPAADKAKEEAARRLAEVKEDIPDPKESIKEDIPAMEPAVKEKGQVLTAEEARKLEAEKEKAKRERRLRRAARLSPNGQSIDMPPTRQAEAAAKQEDDEVKVEIISHPVVEIISHSEPQVDVTAEK